MSSISLKNIVKKFDEVIAVNNINFEIKDGEFVTLLGPSGCGKTTTLKIIAGLLEQTEGEIYFGDKNITNLPSHKRNIGLVFQDYALFPHMNVYKNVSFGLEMKKFNKKEIDKRVKRALEMVDMEGFEERRPGELSGGQQQRIAMARALAFDPELLLFDEPLSNLDAKLRQNIRLELRTLQETTKKTTIYVTHDQQEALEISDRIILMNKGFIEQIGTPEELYDNPQSYFAADFIGSNNFIKGKVIDVTGDTKTIQSYENIFKVKTADKKFNIGSEVIICIRPENLRLLTDNEPKDNVLPAEVAHKIYVGSLVVLQLKVKNISDNYLKMEINPSEAKHLKEGQNVKVYFSTSNLVPAE